MKKLSLLICLIVIFSCLCGCQNKTDDQDMISGYMDGIYFSFEDALAASTDIVKAKCIAVSYPKSNEKAYEFEIIQRFLGENVTENIFVHCYYKYLVSLGNSEKGYSFMDDPLFEIGETYYLVLERRVSVYQEHDEYRNSVALIKIPLSNIQNSTMYGEPLTEHSQIQTLEDEQDIENYIVNYLESNPDSDRLLYNGKKYIMSDDLETIVDGSDFVLKIKIRDLDHKYDDISFYNCTVISSLKGDVEEEDTVCIKFFEKDVVKGWTYIVTAVFIEETDMFEYSAKDSVYSVFKENKIKNYISQ